MSEAPSDGRTVIEELLRRYEARQSVDELYAPEYRPAVNSAAAFVGVRVHGTPDAHVAALDANGVVISVRRITEGAADRFLLESVWVHQDGTSGSSGRFWTVLTLRDGLVAGEEHFDREATARRRAGLPPA